MKLPSFACCFVWLGALLLSGCGGGEQVEKFNATRVLALGDESSVINSSGAKYSVNAVLADNTTLDCRANPLWVQSVAAAYGLVFPQCNPLAVAAPTSRILATPGARVTDLANQVQQQIGNGGFTPSDLVTVLVGANDILAQYAQYPAVPEAQLTANLEAAGLALAQQVNQVARLGARVLLAVAPDMGYTPLAVTEEAAAPGRAALLSRLSTHFNTALRSNIVNDGRQIGLVLLDQYVVAVAKARAEGNGSFVNTTLAACLPSAILPACTTQTLGTDTASPAVPANALTWFWADATHLSPGGQNGLASLALTRVENNPF
jgi:outer membrane lipase/esterase